MQTDDGWLCRGSAVPDLGCYIVLGSVVELQACKLLTLLSCTPCLQMDPKFLRNQVSCHLLLAGKVLHVSRMNVCSGSILSATATAVNGA